MGFRTDFSNWFFRRVPVLAAKDPAPRAPAGAPDARRVELEQLGRKAGGILHDLNNLLTVILGYSELALACEGDTATVHNAIYEVHQSALYASALTRQYLRPPDHEGALELSDLDQVLRNMRGTLEGLLGKPIPLQLELQSGGHRVRASAVQIVQIILNLAINARDAMPEGGLLQVVTSTIEYSRLPAADQENMGAFVALTVRDSGVGMNSETLQRIFDPFFSTKGHRGMGLGLTTVRDAAHAAGGFVRVESEPGMGTCFRVYLPAVRAEDELPAEAAKAEGTPFHPGQALAARATVVVVEDHPSSRELIVDVLKAEGYHVLECDHGDRAFELCCGTPETIDLLLTDVHLPGMSGSDLACRIQKLRPEISVLLVSGDLSGPVSANRQGSTPWAVLAKPFTTGELCHSVRQLLAPRRAAGGISTGD